MPCVSRVGLLLPVSLRSHTLWREVLKRKMWLGLLSVLCSAGALIPPQPAVASPGEGKLTINLFRDFAAKGNRDDNIQVPLGPGQVQLCEERRSRTCRVYPFGSEAR